MKLTVCRYVFLFLCLACMIALSAVRSRPVYGKLDFLLIDGRPWWQPWQPMIERVVKEGDKPVLSDMSTSTVLRAVFAQKTVSFRFDRKFSTVDVGSLVQLQQQARDVLPVGALLLLLNTGQNAIPDNHGLHSGQGIDSRLSVAQILTYAAQQIVVRQKEFPYRCVINLKGFTPSWVSEETGHWSTQWSDTAWFYEFEGKRGKDAEAELRNRPPEHCTVFYRD